jgi:hypothetical protein
VTEHTGSAPEATRNETCFLNCARCLYTAFGPGHSRRTMSPADWNDDQLNALRQRADTLGDQLAARLYSRDAQHGRDFGRVGYNQLLNLTDKLEEAPELMLVEDSAFQRHWQLLPPEFAGYFKPMAAPEWVDTEKLAVASRMWKDDSLGMLVVLFLGSLPACYLMARGIPALYQTDKLANRRYISQRIYETGLMLDTVMDEGGLRVVTDVDVPPVDDLCTALNQLDPTGNWSLEGRTVRRKGTTPAIDIPPQLLERTIAEVDARSVPKRFIGGPGYITIKKVRLLHASMRYMLRHPGVFKPAGNPSGLPMSLAEVNARRTDAWDTAGFGLPVNQEDLAYTLLTFGYAIPNGLEKWGWKFTAEEKHAFLHLWRLTGHVIGVEDELMTDDWDEAGRIFDRIQKHQSAPSRDGVELTNVLLEFVEDYLPTFFGLNKKLPGPAIRDLVGPEADKILAEPVLLAAKRPSRRLLWWCVRTVLRVFNWIRNCFNTVPGLTGMFSDPIHRICEELIESCRGAYRREPFFLPVDETTWIPQFGASQEFLDTLIHWRQRVFKWVFVSVVPLMFGAIGGCATIVLLFLRFKMAWLVGLSSVACFVLSLLSLHVMLPRVLAERPCIEDAPTIEKSA